MSQGRLQAIEGTTSDSAKLGMKPWSSTGRWSLKMEIFINTIILLPKAIRTSQALINALPLKKDDSLRSSTSLFQKNLDS